MKYYENIIATFNCDFLFFYSLYFLPFRPYVSFPFLFFFFSLVFFPPHTYPHPHWPTPLKSHHVFIFQELFLHRPDRVLSAFIFLSSSLALSFLFSFFHTLTLSHTHYRRRTKPKFKAWFAQEKNFWIEGAAWCTLKREEEEET